MRQLFLPMCLCLVTWSSATGSNPRMTLDDFERTSATKRGQIATGQDVAIRQEETASAVIEIPGVKKTSPPDADEIAALVPNLAAEFPVPSGVVINNGIPIGIPLPPIQKPVVARSEDEICTALTAAAQQNDVPAPFFIRLLFQESRFRPEVVSHAGAQGIAQFMPGTADQMGLENPYDPVQAIPASARLLGQLVRQFGNLGLAAAAYNAGPKRITDWLAAKGKAKLPDETQGYVKVITGKPVEHWTAATARHPAQKVQEHAPCQAVAGLLAYAGPDEVPLPVSSPLRAIKVAENTKPAQKKTADKPADATRKTTSDSQVEAKIEPKAEPKAEPKTDTKADLKAAAKKSDKPDETPAAKTPDKTASANAVKPNAVKAKPEKAGSSTKVSSPAADQKPKQPKNATIAQR